MSVSVFDFRDYKTYVRSWIEARPSGGHGQKSRIATHLKCHIAYISQVLNAAAHLSIEQADTLNSYLEHTEDEADFFILLVQHGRAGTHSLEIFFEKKIQRILQQRLLFRNRIPDRREINIEDQATYYSAWYYAAIHMAVLVPELRTVQRLSAHFGLPVEKIRRTVDFLLSVGLVREQQGNLQPGLARIHLLDDSPMISKHHTNWRMKAIQSLEGERAEDLHYSSVIGISEADLPRVREILLRAIEEVRKVVKDSPDERVCCYALDLFNVRA